MSRPRAPRSISATLLGPLLLLLAASGAPAQEPEDVSPTRGSRVHGQLPDELDCAACHTAAGWRPLREPLGFEHGDSSSFPLVGMHREVECAACHEGLRFDGPDVAAGECGRCHVDPHAGRLAEDCAACHEPVGPFRDVAADEIHARSAFPLTGAHRQITCEGCHVDEAGGSFGGLDPTCLSCHRSDFVSAVTVDHVSSGFTTECLACHGTVDWSDAPLFDHASASAGFELVGVHRRVTCAGCHAPPAMVLLFPAPAGTEDCVACHRPEYDRVHGGTGFPTRCIDCHDPSSWGGATFDHPGFPIFVGRHADVWADCSTCHTPPGDFGTFSCLDCHEHARGEMDDEHEDVAGYVYESASCLTCHPSGTA